MYQKLKDLNLYQKGIKAKNSSIFAIYKIFFDHHSLIPPKLGQLSRSNFQFIEVLPFINLLNSPFFRGSYNRNQKLSNLIYTTNGSLTVKAYSEEVFWSSRQINRYFNQTFGLSLKAYCNILRFRASFQQIKEGKLLP